MYYLNNIDFETPIEYLNFSGQSLNALRALRLLTVSDIINLSEQDLYNIENLGKISVNDIYTVIVSLKKLLLSNDHIVNDCDKGRDDQLLEEFGLIPRTRLKRSLKYFLSATNCKMELGALDTVEELKGILANYSSRKEDFDIMSKFLLFLGTDYVECVSSLVQKAFKDTYSRTRRIVRQKSLGLPLRDISKSENLSFERARQIDTEFIDMLTFHISAIGFDIVAVAFADLGDDRYLAYDDVAGYYKDVEDVATLMRIVANRDLYLSRSFGYQSRYKGFFYFDTEDGYIRVWDVVKELPHIVFKDQLDSLLEYHSQKNAISIQMLKEAFLKRYNQKGPVYHTGRLALIDVYQYIMEQYYPSGMRVYDAQALSEFRKRIRDVFGEINIPGKNRSLSAKLATCSILYGCGMYIHPSYVHIERDLVSEIFDYIFKSDKTEIPFGELFETFNGRLLQKSNITNKYQLHGVLMRYGGHGEYEEYGLRFSMDHLSKGKRSSVNDEPEEF